MEESTKKFLILFAILLRSVSTCPWADGDNGQVSWASGCELLGKSFRSVPSPSEKCGSECINNKQCTTFNWVQNGKDGICYMKDESKDHRDIESAYTNIAKEPKRYSCGFINSRISGKSRCQWQGADCDVAYMMKCDFNGNDIGLEKSLGKDCGGICLANEKCTHFTWKPSDEGGVCILKQSTCGERRKTFVRVFGPVCGFIKSRIYYEEK